MSTNQPPARRHSPAVYRRRRLVVLLGLVAVIVAIVLIIVRPGASQGEETGGQSKPPATSTSPSTAASETPPAEGAEAGGACAPEQVIVEAVTNKTEYAEGEQPELSVTVRNTGAAACTLNAGTTAQVFTIKSGDETYWTSTDCQTSPSDAQITLEPNDPISSAVPIIWDRTRSSVDTCDGAREAVPGGGASYHLDVTVDGIPSTASKQFMLF